MKNIIYYFLLICMFFPSWSYAKNNSNIDAQEIYLAFYPRAQYLEIIEYNLVSKNTNMIAIKDDVENLKSLIKQAKYSSTKYSFEHFIPVEETISNEKKIIKGHYHLVTQKKDLHALTDAIGSILNKKVTFEITKEKIKVFFNGKGFKVNSANALGVYGKNDERTIVWKNGGSKFELIAQFNIRGMTPLLNLINEPIKSPEKSIEEIDKIKSDSPKLLGPLQDWQDDADIFRLRHLKYYGELIESYKRKTKRYPFESSEKNPIYVFIAHERQDGDIKPIPYPHKIISFRKFVKEMESKLGHTIKQYFDPQFVPVKKPNYYVYMIRDKQYFFAIHVSNYYFFANKLGDNYYKVEISNKPLEGTKILTLNELISNKSFLEAIEKKANKENFFKDREQKYINYVN